MSFKELVKKNRSYRRFEQQKAISEETCRELIDIARYTPSGANKQSTRYMISCTPQKNEKVFESLRWAGYYQDWDGPEEGERPTAYIIMLAPVSGEAFMDEGIKGQTILLAAAEQGIAGCFLQNVDRKTLAPAIGVPEAYKIGVVLALGYPKEQVKLEEILADGDIRYYRDEEQTHHVPKIRLEDLILN